MLNKSKAFGDQVLMGIKSPRLREEKEREENTPWFYISQILN